MVERPDTSRIKSGEKRDCAVKRRDLLKQTGISAIAAGSMFSSTASASSDTDQSRFEIRLQKVTSREVNQAIESHVVQRLADDLKNLRFNRQEARKRIVLANKSVIGRAVRIPTEIGILDVILDGSKHVQATLALKRKHLHNSTISRIEAILDWPAETNGYLKCQRSEEGIRFSRTVSQSEELKLRKAAQLSTQEAAMGVSYSLLGTSRNPPEVTFHAVQDQNYFRFGPRLNDVIEQRTFGSQGPSTKLTDCQSMAGACFGDILMAFPGCAVSAAACGLTGPVTAACVVAVLAICGPEVGLVAVSGNCSYVAYNCL